MSSGEWNTVICAIIARTSSRTATGSPVRLIRAKECRATATGSPATVECARTNLRSAPEVSASRSSTGRESGGTSWTASFCTPVPSRTVPKSSSRGRRSHSPLAHRDPPQRVGGGAAPLQRLALLDRRPPAQCGLRRTAAGASTPAHGSTRSNR
ncbi:hypothetical protein [Streptosporangium nondiastaticum]|uniref:hypothetical protein n=1 Tax=Streptosporangium nondiastaticum TaxID=35764 RepID=UPI0031F848F7